MATAPTWFDATNYLNVKTAQLNTTKFQDKTDWTNTTTEAALKAAGMTPFEHFEKFGNVENISPNNMFNVAEYLLSKAEQLNAIKFEGKTTWDEASVLATLNAAGLSAWDHYTQYGFVEGINPSNAFDTSAYMAEKLAELKASEPAANWTMESMNAAFKAAGLNPLEHFQLYGKTEGLTEVAVPNGEKVFSNFNPYAPAAPGEVFTLTTAVDNIKGTANNDTINGVASSLTSEQTLNNADVIDGGAGVDTLNVNMKASFNGFTTGSMVNVENVNLTNTGSIARTFDAKGITGVETYNINATGAAVTLSNLDSAAVTVNLQGQTKGSASIGFAAKVLDGTNDTLNLGLSSVGTDTVDIGVTATGIENLNVKVTDNNFVNLANAASKTITVSGAGNLNVTDVATGLTSFDATNMSGGVNADLSTATGISTIKGGSGDDTFTVASTGIASTATIVGGAGNDSLIVTGAGSLTLQPTMSGIENVTAQNGVNLTLSGKNASDLSSVTVMGTANITLAGVQADNFAINTQGAASGTVIMDTATALTYNTVAGATKTNADTATVTASKATTATVNVGVDTQAAGILNLAAATAVTVNVAQSFAADGTTENTSFAGTINANKAASLNVNADGVLANGAAFNVAEATSVTVVAEKGGVAAFAAGAASDVSITAGAAFAIGTTGFAGAQNVTLVQNAGALTGGMVLGSLNTLTVSGAGTAANNMSKVTLGNLGKGDLGYDLTVNASGLKGGFTAADIDAFQNAVNLNFAGVTGAVGLGTIKGSNVTINAANAGTTAFGVITATGDVTIDGIGLIGGDLTTKAITAVGIGAMAANKSINISFDGGSDIGFGALTANTTTGTINIDASGYLGSRVGLADSGTAGTTAQAEFLTLNANTVSIKGSDIGINDFTGNAAITGNHLTFTSGLQIDKVAMIAQGGATAMTANLNTGAGNDAVTLTGVSTTTSIVATGNMGGNGTYNSAATADSDYITINAIAGTAVGGLTIDISGLAGYVGSTITGGTKADKITLGSGVDNLKLGNVTAAGIDSITGFTAGDTFMFNATPTTFAKVTGVDFEAAVDLDAALTLLVAGVLTVNSALVFTYKGSTYGVIDGGTAGYSAGDDAVVKLVGLTEQQAVDLGDVFIAA